MGPAAATTVSCASAGAAQSPMMKARKPTRFMVMMIPLSVTWFIPVRSSERLDASYQLAGKLAPLGSVFLSDFAPGERTGARIEPGIETHHLTGAGRAPRQ